MVKKLKSKFYSALYIALIVVSNMVTIWFKPISIGTILVPPSSWFMGFTFLLINIISAKESKLWTSSLIWIGLGITSLICFIQQLPQSIVIASGVAFIVSQYVSNLLYNKLKKGHDDGFLNFVCSFLGSLIDAAIWIVLGLSPLGIGSVLWSGVIWAIAGQVIVQAILQRAALLFIPEN